MDRRYHSHKNIFGSSKDLSSKATDYTSVHILKQNEVGIAMYFVLYISTNSKIEFDAVSH